MKYVCLVYLEEQKLRAVPDSECLACGDALRKNGVLVAAEALQPAATARTVRLRNGKLSVTDGPFTETKEHLAGFYLVEANDLNERSSWPARSRRCGREASRSARSGSWTCVSSSSLALPASIVRPGPPRPSWVRSP